MQLIGMLDSPYVRRVAISLTLLELPFDHQPLSVFSTFEQFSHINPVVKAPSLVCDDGEVLMDSSLILDYAEHAARPDRTLMPQSLIERQHVLRVIGLALAACEKTVQIVYERSLRPAEKQHEPWLARVGGQLLAAYRELEHAIENRPLDGDRLDQAGVTSVVAWSFTQMILPGVIDSHRYPRLDEFARSVESLPAFLAHPQR